MSLRSLLETFDGAVPRSSVSDAETSARDSSIAAEKSRAYEAGYASGWEDAHRSDDEAHLRVAAEFERNIETLAFTYHEAVDLVRAELAEFLDAIVESFLPPMLPDLTRAHLRDALRKLGEEQTVLPIEIVVSSDSLDLVEGMMSEDFSLDLSVVEDASLAPHQVFLRMGQRETAIDLAPLVDSLRSQLGAMTLNQIKPEEDKDVRA